MRVPLWWCEQMTGRSLFWHGRAEVGTRNNKENCKGSGQNMPSSQCGLGKPGTQLVPKGTGRLHGKEGLERTLCSQWPCESAFKAWLFPDGPSGDLKVCEGFQCFSLKERH